MPVQNANGKPDQHPPMFAAGSFLPVFLVTALFIFWGIASNLNDILIKQFMKSFELARYKAALIQSAFFLGYFIVAVPAALVMRRFGYKAGLVIGLLQALTQIQEMTLVFVPKIIAIFVVLLIALPFAGEAMGGLMTDIAQRIAAY